MEHVGDDDTNRSRWVQYNPHGLMKKTGGTGINRKNRDYLDNSIIKIGKNTEMSPGELRRVAVSQNPANAGV